MNFLKKIDHYLLTNHPVLWRTKVHYFVLFSLILGNIVMAVISNAFLKSPHIGIAYISILGVVLLVFMTLMWLVSQSRIKIKTYRFWDEVLTFGVYMFCALSLFMNFMVLIQMPIIKVSGGHYEFVPSYVIGMSVFVFVLAILVYLITHTGVANILGVIILHSITVPLSGLLIGMPIIYLGLFFMLFPLFYFIAENNSVYRFIRYFLIPYIPLALLLASVYIYESLDNDIQTSIPIWMIIPLLMMGLDLFRLKNKLLHSILGCALDV